jgi:hypothetical protein
MGKLSKDYPVIEKIKNRMKKDDNFTNDQVRDFERKTSRTYSNMFLVEMLQEFDNARIKISQLCLKKDEDIKTLQKSAEAHRKKYEEAEERIIEEFGTKSYEYQIFKGRFSAD